MSEIFRETFGWLIGKSKRRDNNKDTQIQHHHLNAQENRPQQPPPHPPAQQPLQQIQQQQQRPQQQQPQQQQFQQQPQRQHDQHIYSQPIYRRNPLTGSPVEAEYFKRSAKSRMSLPINSQQSVLRRQAYSMLQQRGPFQQPQSLGHIYLQYQGETKRANLADQLTTLDTIRALFVCAFPNLLTMEYMSRPHVKIYIYNPSCNIFYELRDIDDVKHESVLRIHQVEPFLNAAHQLNTMALQPTPSLQHHLQHRQTPPQYNTMMRITPHHQLQQQPQQLLTNHHHQSQIQLYQSSQQPTPQIPPPKPRRMIPVVNGGNIHNPNLIYGTMMPSSTPLNSLQ